MQAQRIRSSRIAEEIEAIVRSFLAAARDRQAVRQDDTTLDLNLVGGGRGAVVTLRDRGRHIRIGFTDSKRPACDVYVHLGEPNMVEIHYAGETLPNWRARLQEVRHFAVGLPERYLYGWVEAGCVTTLLLANENAYQDGISYPAGLEAYVLEGKQLPRVLQMARNVDDALMRDWHQRFWSNVAAGNIVKLGGRVRWLPGETWMTCQNHKAYITFDAPDDRQPLLAHGPYQFWHPREKHPGELNMLKNWPDSRNPLRNWFFAN